MIARAARHHPGHRPDRLGQDHHALLDAEGARHARVNVCTIEDPIEMVEPAFNQMQVQHGDRPRLRRRRAHAAAPGPGHHHGRRDPRPRDRRDGDPGGADRPPRALDAAHQRRADARSRACSTSASPPYLLNSTLLGVMAQRLVRTLCPHCKQTVELNRAEDPAWDALVAPWKAEHAGDRSTCRSAASNAA